MKMMMKPVDMDCHLRIVDQPTVSNKQLSPIFITAAL